MAKTRICSVEECSKSTVSLGFCSSHAARFRRYGDPLGGRTFKGDAVKFINETVLTYDGDECILWPFGNNGVGYGQLHIGKRKVYAHRFICEKENGSPPSSLHQAAHSCGNGHLGCVNRRHLSWKTRLENEADKVEHGTLLRGENTYNSKLTAPDVLEIRRLRGVVYQQDLAARFGVTDSLISMIQTGKRWGHIS